MIRTKLTLLLGALGLVAYPYFFFVELLAPVVEVVGLVGLIAGLTVGALNAPFAGLFFRVAYGYGLVLSAFTLVLCWTSYLDHLELASKSLGERGMEPEATLGSPFLRCTIAP